MRHLRLLLVLIAIAGPLFSIAQDQVTEDPLVLGVQAYKNARYEDAVEYFKRAIAADPTRLKARLYLGTDYAQQVMPGVESAENEHLAMEAIAEFRQVLELDPSDEQKISALKGIAALFFNINDLEKARENNRQVITADPLDPEPYYTIGVIDWTHASKPRMEAQQKLGLAPADALTDPIVCAQVRALNEDRVKEGIDMFAKALELRPDYDDAMAYMNLMLRERADIQCGNAAAREADLAKADEWVNLTLATKRRKAEQRMPPPPPATPKQ